MNCTIDLTKYNKMIYSIVNRVYKQDTGIDKDDLIQAAYEAILNAYKGFDKNKHSKISTYLYRCISRAVRQEQNKQLNMITIPRSIMDYAGHLYKAERIYNTEKDIVNYIEKNSNLTLNQAKTLYNYKNISRKKDIDIEVMNNITGLRELDIDTQIDTQLLIKRLRYLTSLLTINQRMIIELKYFSDKEYSFEDIAKLLNKNIENIWTTHKVAIKQLRKRYKSKFKERI